ncbi:hypothetical protein E4V01_15595 [Methylorubrum sp. Q1]|nr:hypothetical protein E4V01_15595 [Methylorubrum sp. Q1]
MPLRRVGRRRTDGPEGRRRRAQPPGPSRSTERGSRESRRPWPCSGASARAGGRPPSWACA